MSNKKSPRRASILEALKELGTTEPKPAEFVSQFFGDSLPSLDQHYSGELFPQEEIEIGSILSGEHEVQTQLKRQLALERRLREEEKALFEKKSQELKLTLHAITMEVQTLAVSTPKLVQEIQIAAIQAPTNPGIYHVVFFEKLLEYLKGFRKRTQDAQVWLHSLNKRAAKKGFWAQYKKHGGRRLLSAEDYSQRSAG